MIVIGKKLFYLFLTIKTRYPNKRSFLKRSSFSIEMEMTIEENSFHVRKKSEENEDEEKMLTLGNLCRFFCLRS